MTGGMTSIPDQHYALIAIVFRQQPGELDISKLSQRIELVSELGSMVLITGASHGFLLDLVSKIALPLRSRIFTYSNEKRETISYSEAGEQNPEHYERIDAFVRRLLWEKAVDASEVIMLWDQGIEEAEVMLAGDLLESFDEGSTVLPVDKPKDILELLSEIVLRIESKKKSASVPKFVELDSSWLLVEGGFSQAREAEIESLLTISNGYAGTRGTLFERGSPLGPGTIVAGVFDKISGANPVPGLVAAPDWIRLRIETICAEETGLTCGRFFDNRRVLDMKRGMMWRELKHQDLDGRISWIRGFRIASQSDRHLFLQSLRLTPLNFSGLLRIEAEADLYRSSHKSFLNPYPIRIHIPIDINTIDGSPIGINYTYKNKTEIAFAAATRIVIENGQDQTVLLPKISRIEDRAAEQWEFEAEIGKTYRIDRVVSIFTSRDTDHPVKKARERISNALEKSIAEHTSLHVNEWRKLWATSDIQIVGDDDSDRALRFACYSLLSAANPDDAKTSIGARALTGSSYLGHVFWDTEIFMLPFFIYTSPHIAKNLLMYRYNTLNGARKNAKQNGFSGAMYAWESADTGEEVTPSWLSSSSGEKIRILTGEQEHHITADVAFAVWQYYEATNDRDFLDEAGAEILIETARFWASRVKLGNDGFYHIENIIGPDEYHEQVSDSAYTNLLAKWNLQQSAKAISEVQAHSSAAWQKLSNRISFDDKELQQWSNVTEKLTKYNMRDDVIEQHSGFFNLEEVTTSKENQPGGVDFRIFLDLEKLSKTQLIKQADVVLLLYLFWDEFSAKQRQNNFNYYEQRTLHGSSLSPAIYSLIAARLGETSKAIHYYKMAAEVDLENNMSNASGGVHSAAQGGLWQATVFGFGGMNVSSKGVSFDPKIPPHWEELSFHIVWRGQKISVNITKQQIEISNKGGAAVPVKIGSGEYLELEPQDKREWKRLYENNWQEVA